MIPPVLTPGKYDVTLTTKYGSDTLASAFTVTPYVDSDGDGIADDFEDLNHDHDLATDDTDGDGLCAGVCSIFTPELSVDWAGGSFTVMDVHPKRAVRSRTARMMMGIFRMARTS